jgi:arabinofuranosyltransferase
LTSLARQHRNAPLRSPTPERGETPSVKPRGAIGIGGYLDGPRVHTIDFLGLADPLLARLPSHDRHWWRIGHFERKLPEGYWATLETGRNEIADPKLAVYYDYLSIVTRGEVLSIERIKTIARFNLGAYDSLIDTEFYTRPYSKTITLDDLEKKRKRDGFPWDHESNVRLAPRNGVLVDLREERHCDAILLGLAGATRYRITYYRSGSPLASYRSTAGSAAEFFHLTPFIRRSGLQKHLIEVPEDIADGGYDAFMIYPLDASNSREHSIGYIDLCPDRIPR